MSNLSQFFGGSGLKPTSITRTLPPVTASNPTSATGTYTANVPANSGIGGAGTLQQVLSVTGKGALTWLGLFTVDAVSRTYRVKITLDGAVIYDQTNIAGGATVGRWIVAHGAPGSSTGYPATEGTPIFYNNSLLVEVASSISDASPWATVGYINYLR